MSEDTISRQAAIDFIDAGRLCNPNEPRWSDNEVVNFLKTRPSAQPERKKGRWAKQTDENCWWYECSECGVYPPKNASGHEVLSEYCPNCGALMREDCEER